MYLYSRTDPEWALHPKCALFSSQGIRAPGRAEGAPPSPFLAPGMGLGAATYHHSETP